MRTFSLRDTDVISRWGGEEFLILLPETEAKESVKISEKIRKVIEEKNFSYGEKLLKITISIGVEDSAGGNTIDELLKQVDIALYKAKENGLNNVSCYKE